MDVGAVVVANAVAVAASNFCYCLFLMWPTALATDGEESQGTRKEIGIFSPFDVSLGVRHMFCRFFLRCLLLLGGNC